MLTLLLALAATAADTWTEPAAGVSLLERRAGGQRITAAYVERCAALHPRATRYAERRARTSAWGRGVGASIAVNGAFFSYDDYDAIGWSVGAGEAWPTARDDARFTAIGFASRGRARIWEPVESLPPPREDWWTEVVPGDPLLVRDGQVVREPCYSHMCERHPRTAVGLTDDGRVLLVTVDGRQADAAGMTRLELAALLVDLGAERAMNLDGGGSTTMWVDGRGVVNRPSDGSERVVASHLGFVAGDPVGCCERRPVDGANGTFRDLPDDHWARPYAEALYDAGVTSGCQADPPLFCPDCVLDRAHLGALVARAAGLAPSDARTFSDVPPDAWYAGHLEALREAGITTGCAPDAFCPERLATRFEAAAVVARAMGLPSVPPTGRFTDVPPASAGMIEALAEACVVAGCGPDSFCPDREITRAEAAKMLAVGLSVGPFAPCDDEEPGDTDDTGEVDDTDDPTDPGDPADPDLPDGGDPGSDAAAGCGCASPAAPVGWIGLALGGLVARRRGAVRRGQARYAPRITG